MQYIVEESLANFEGWSGAEDTILRILEENKADEFENLIEQCFSDRIPTQTEINDFLRFEYDFIFDELGIQK